MRFSLLLALAAVGACATPPPASDSSTPAPVGAAEADTALVSLIQEPDGSALVSVTFRSEENAPSGVAISPDYPLRIETPTGTFEAALDGEPRGVVVHVTTESSADYRLAAAGVSAMEQAGEGARVSVHDGERYRAYAVRRVDFLE